MNQSLARFGFICVVCISASYILKVADDFAGVLLEIENLRNEVDTFRDHKKERKTTAKSDGKGQEEGTLDSDKRTWNIDWTQSEFQLFQAVLLNTSNFQTFGVGPMTIEAIKQKHIQHLQAIDCSHKWLDEFTQKKEVFTARVAGRLNVTLVDIGSVTEFGLPLSTDHQAEWHRYSDIGYEFRPDLWWDTVLIDGRFRMASFLKVVLKVYLTGRQAMTKLMYHDYNRPGIQVIEQFAPKVYMADSLGIFIVKPVIHVPELQKMISEVEKNFE